MFIDSTLERIICLWTGFESDNNRLAFAETE